MQKKKLLYLFCIFLLSVHGCSSSDSRPLLQSLVSPQLFHNHPLDATYRQLDSGIRIFLLTETLGHSHTVELPEEHSILLKMGVPIDASSSIDLGHSHPVTLRKME